MVDAAEINLRGGKFKRLMERELSDLRKEYGLKRIEMEVLYLLDSGAGNDTVAQIADFLNANRGHISQTAESLCEKGCLVSIQDQKDRRYVHFILTDRGRAVCVPIREQWRALMQELFAGLTEEELETYRRISTKIRQNMERIL
ncbi:MAG: winged helix DNA-binding protein [Oscillospiraceae bacterium]|nr:winged helix DNA-binding protein [Oscillospiraceae bacterium]